MLRAGLFRLASNSTQLREQSRQLAERIRALRDAHMNEPHLPHKIHLQEFGHVAHLTYSEYRSYNILCRVSAAPQLLHRRRGLT